MKSRGVTIWVMLVVGVLLVVGNSAVMGYSGGSGSLGDPYLISTPADLEYLSDTSADCNKHFRLDADLDMVTIVGFTPIGDQTIKFTGTFDGNDHTISNLTIDLPVAQNVGLFGYVQNDVDPNTIFDLGLIEADITGGNRSGSLAGYIYSGTITNCYATGSVSGGTRTHIGGLVGLSYGTIRSCYATGDVDGDNFSGGLVGWNGNTITNCYATGTVIGIGNYTGGLVGYDGDTITNSYATGDVDGGNFSGGLVGDSAGTVTNKCYAMGNVTGGIDTGGLIGRNYGGTISYCYATGSVTGDGYTGGLVGYNRYYISNRNRIISNCYATGSVTGTDGNFTSVGGLVGRNGCIVTQCYAIGTVTGDNSTGGLVGDDSTGDGETNGSCWDTETSGQATSAGGTGLTTSLMQSIASYAGAAGWDFNLIWGMSGYPHFKWEDVIFCANQPRGDLSGDCVVNFTDFGILAGSWMDCGFENPFYCP